MNRRAAYEAVDRFEKNLSEYTGAPYVVVTDSGTNALFMAFLHAKQAGGQTLTLPKFTYVGVAQAAWNAGWEIEWSDEPWHGYHHIPGTNIVDSAKFFMRGMYEKFPESLVCVSFGASKRLHIGRGGAVLTDSKEVADWIRPRTMDGRTPGENYKTPRFARPAYHVTMTPDQAVRGQELLVHLDEQVPNTVFGGHWEYPDLSGVEWV